MPQRLAPERVARLDRERVQRPEVGLAEAEQRTPADPSNRQDRQNHDSRADPRRLGEAVGGLADPGPKDERRETEQDGRQQDRDDPGEQELRQADFGEQAAGDRQQRALLGGGMVALHVAEARIENWPCAFGRKARSIGRVTGIVHAGESRLGT